MRVADREQIDPAGRSAWRSWLIAHHSTSPGVWVVLNSGSSSGRFLTLDDAVEEALCFGWIDSRLRRLADGRRALMFTPRRPRSIWAQSNKQRIERLIAEGQMTDAGLAVVEKAKQDGSWNALDDVDALVIPEDLVAALTAQPGALSRFRALSAPQQKAALWWIGSARMAQTRSRRIDHTVGSLPPPSVGR